MPVSLEEKRRLGTIAEWEGLCDPRKGCGTQCCFYEGSACEELKWTDRKHGIGVCRVYPTRHGTHKTLEGKEFVCSGMAHWLTLNVPVDECGYFGITAVDGKKTAFAKEFSV